MVGTLLDDTLSWDWTIVFEVWVMPRCSAFDVGHHFSCSYALVGAGTLVVDLDIDLDIVDDRGEGVGP